MTDGNSHFEEVCTTRRGQRYRVRATVTNAGQRNVCRSFVYDLTHGYFENPRRRQSLEESVQQCRAMHAMPDLEVTLIWSAGEEEAPAGRALPQLPAAVRITEER